jgi:hypothetical protein
MVTATTKGQIVSWVNKYDGLPHVVSITAAPEQTQAEPQVPDAVVKAELSTTTITITVQPSVCPANSAVTSATSSVTAWMTVSNDIVPDTASIPLSSASSTTTDTPALAPSPSSSEPPSDPLDDTQWTQRAYYNMKNRTAKGLTFLNNLGVNGMIFASADGASGAGSAQIFEGELKSQQEISIFSGVNCDAGNCGYSRPNSVAYGTL